MPNSFNIFLRKPEIFPDQPVLKGIIRKHWSFMIFPGICSSKSLTSISGFLLSKYKKHFLKEQHRLHHPTT